MIDKDVLRRERRLSETELQSVIGHAARLQREARELRHASVDVAEVAGELDIAPEYVDEALKILERERALEAEKKAHQARLKRLGLFAAAGLAAVVAVSTVVAGRRLQSSSLALGAARTRFAGAVTRQVDLVPQLVALSGGDAAALTARAQQLRETADVSDMAAAAQAFNDEATRVLAQLPPPGSPSAEQQRLSLQHELTGARNRINVERQRYEAAHAQHERARAGVLAGLARLFGLAD